MAYFDSKKNRALWEIELQNLRKLREDHMSGKAVAAPQTQEAVKPAPGYERVRMTYQDLLKEEAAATRKAPNRERQMAMEHAKEHRKEAPSKEARSL